MESKDGEGVSVAGGFPTLPLILRSGDCRGDARTVLLCLVGALACLLEVMIAFRAGQVRMSEEIIEMSLGKPRHADVTGVRRLRGKNHSVRPHPDFDKNTTSHLAIVRVSQGGRSATTSLTVSDICPSCCSPRPRTEAPCAIWATPTLMSKCPLRSRALPKEHKLRHRHRLSYNDVHKAIQRTAVKIKEEFGTSSEPERTVSERSSNLTDPLQHPHCSSLSAGEGSFPPGSCGPFARTRPTGRRGTFPFRLSVWSCTSPWAV